MARRGVWLLGGALAAACALPDVDVVTSFSGGAGAGRGGETSGGGGKGGTAGRGGSSGKGTGGTAGTSNGDAGESGDGNAVGGSGGQTGVGGAGGSAGKSSAGQGGTGTAGVGAAPAAGTGGDSGASGTGGAGKGGGSGSGGMSSNVCGNGMWETGEECDDGNDDACGTCSADCQTEMEEAAAQGLLHVEGGFVNNAEKFVLDDGFGAVEFEFVENYSGTPPVPERFIDFNDSMATDELRDRIVAVINSDGNGLGITAAAGDEDGDIVLTNDHIGSVGNQQNTELVSHVSFTLTDMTGGAGYDCLLGTGCLLPTACASMVCENEVCVP
jgi:hypothetical protein